MKRIVYALLATLSGVVLLFSYRTSLPEVDAEPAPVDTSSADAASAAPTPTETATPTQTPTPTATVPASGLLDGTYTGAAADTRYGDVQVSITVAGGEITVVEVPVYPNTDPHDARINDQAVPILVSETLAAQSVEIDMVSGATYTSEGYLESLQSAIDQATA